MIAAGHDIQDRKIYRHTVYRQQKFAAVQPMLITFTEAKIDGVVYGADDGFYEADWTIKDGQLHLGLGWGNGGPEISWRFEEPQELWEALFPYEHVDGVETDGLNPDFELVKGRVLTHAFLRERGMGILVDQQWGANWPDLKEVGTTE